MGSTQRRPDIAEVFSPPRVTAMAGTMELKAGVALDLRTADAEGRRWDFDDPEVCRRALDLVRATKPRLLIGSPDCTAFSNLQNLSKGRRDPVVVKALWERACKHLEFCTLLYHEQLRRGDLFVHEHPSSASSWKQECMQRLGSRIWHRDERRTMGGKNCREVAAIRTQGGL